MAASYLSSLLDEIQSDGADSVGGQRHNHHKYLNDGDPIRKKRAVIGGVAAQATLAHGSVRGRPEPPGRPPPGRNDPAHHAHAVLAPVRVVKDGVQQPKKKDGGL